MTKETTREFLDLRHRSAGDWQLRIALRHTGGRGSLFGGVGLAAAIAALEQEAQVPVVWATAQFISRTRQPAVMDLDVRMHAVGRSVRQVQVSGYLGDRQVISVMEALGARTEVARVRFEDGVGGVLTVLTRGDTDIT